VIYHGEIFEISGIENVIAPNVPMDPMVADWNQEEKDRRGLGYLAIQFDHIIVIVLQTIFWVGFTGVAFMLYIDQNILNLTFFGIYILLIWINKKIPNPKLWGRVTVNGILSPGLLLELRSEVTPDVVLSKTLTNQNGRFFLKASPGKYLLDVKRINENTNTLLLKRSVTVRKSMILNENIEV
jgi:hypothetical protein